MDEKVNKFYEYVINNLIKSTKVWKEDDYFGNIGIIFPMYDDEPKFFYRMDEIEGWRDEEWQIGTDDIRYLMTMYGLTDVECREVMNIYSKKLATLILSKYRT